MAEEIKTDLIKVKNTIPVIGGPLSSALNNIGITEIKENTNLQSLLLSLFCKEEWPKSIKSTLGTFKATSGVNSFSISANPDRLVEPGTKLYFSATQGAVKGYSTSDSSVTGLEYGYSLENDNTEDGGTTSFSKS
jgi:hypothetical protein